MSFKVGDRVKWNDHTGTIMKVGKDDETWTRWDKDGQFDGKHICRDMDLSLQFKKVIRHPSISLQIVIEQEVSLLKGCYEERR